MQKKILVVGSMFYATPVASLGEVTSNVDDFLFNPKNYKLVLFTGGEDVGPSLYGHTSPRGLCGFNPSRDAYEIPIFEMAFKHGIPMTGICRGSQFLNVMSGGTLMHDIRNHALFGEHYMTSNSAGSFKVTSTHHQMAVLSDDGHLFGYSSEKRSSTYFGDEDKLVHYEGPEVEAFYYPHTKAFAVQYHPECMNIKSAGFLWYSNAVNDLLEMTSKDLIDKYKVEFDGYKVAGKAA